MTFADPAHRSSYSKEQLQKYFDRISLPEIYRTQLVVEGQNAIPDEQLSYLANLKKYHLAAIPFENLELHYSPTKTVSLEPQYLFQKIVVRGDGRGGRCMETNCLFGTVLRSLGFDVYSAGARVNQAAQPVAATKGWKGPRHDGWCARLAHASNNLTDDFLPHRNHMINIVIIANKKYLVDVGFGGSGAPTHPIPLVSDQPSSNIGSQKIRLLLTSISDNTRKDQQLWCYQFCHGENRTWIDGYSFTETEFLPQDFKMMSFFTSTSKTSWFTYRVVCVKQLMENGELVGEMKLYENEVRRRVRGESELLAMLTTEEERVHALEKYLGVKLSEPEVLGIHGMITQLLG
ncbi:MAG: N-terminal acetyltransferase [Alectoria sarmentosa]|nr:MAG: N-terminal acetyltransferase [Alectoria sarmentosa]